MMPFLIWITLLVCAFFIGAWYGSFLYVQLNTSLLENMVNTSQWVISSSSWVISDAVLYVQAGTKNIQGDLPWQINPEVPPLAKLGYGLGQVFFQNPYLFSFACMLVFLFLSWHLIKKLTNSRLTRLLAWLILCSSPLLFAQLGNTMLELPMGVFFLLFLFPIFEETARYSVRLLILSGLGLGFVAACKFPLIPAVLGFLTCVWIARKSIPKALLFAITAMSGYLLAYTPFFLRGLSLIDWARNQWWMVQFYRQGVHQQETVKAIIGMLFGVFNDGGTIKLLQEWSLWWPILLIANIVFWFKKIRTAGFFGLQLIDLLSIASLFILFFTPFQARYFFLPFLLLFFGMLASISKRGLSQRELQLCSFLTILICAFSMIRLYARGPVEESQYLAERWSAKNYLQVDALRADIPWKFTNEVEQTMHEVDMKANIASREIIFSDQPPLFTFAHSWTGLASVKLTTPQGSTLGELRPITFHRAGVQWVFEWDPGLAFPGYSPGCTFEAVLNPNVSVWQNWLGFMDLKRERFSDVIESRDLKRLSQLAEFTDQNYTQMFHTLTLEKRHLPVVRWVVMHPSTFIHQLEAQQIEGVTYTSIYQNTNPMWERTALSRKLVCP